MGKSIQLVIFRAKQKTIWFKNDFRKKKYFQVKNEIYLIKHNPNRFSILLNKYVASKYFHL